MISLRSEEVSIIEDIYRNFKYKKFSPRAIKDINENAFGIKLVRLWRKGLLKRYEVNLKTHKYNYSLDSRAKEVINGDYTLENKCVICGTIHNKWSKTCCDKCNRELSSSTQKALPYMDKKNHELIEKIEKHMEFLNYPTYLSLQNFKYDLDLTHYEPRSLRRVLYAVLEKHDYVQYSAGSVRRVYIRKDALIENKTSEDESCSQVS